MTATRTFTRQASLMRTFYSGKLKTPRISPNRCLIWKVCQYDNTKTQNMNDQTLKIANGKNEPAS